jgi:hypothetical protein
MTAVSSCDRVAISSEPIRVWAMFLGERHQVARAARMALAAFDDSGQAQFVEAALELVIDGRSGHVRAEGIAAALEHREVVRELVAAVLHLRNAAGCRGPQGSRPSRATACGTASGRPP